MSDGENFQHWETPWQLLFRHAFDVALAHGEEDEAVAEILAMAQHRRWAVANARANCSAILSASPEDRPTLKAFALLDRTLREGDTRHSWWSAGAA
jgi:hypothetical protein